MKTRIIHTEIHFDDDWFTTLSIGYRYLFIYLFTNKYIGQTGAYKLSERVALIETGASLEDWKSAKTIFEKSGKVAFIDDYIVVLNAKKHSDYSGGKNAEAYRKEFSALPKSVQDTLSIRYGYPIDTTINKKPEIINDKPEIRNQKGEGKGFQSLKAVIDKIKEEGKEAKNGENSKKL